jgi:protein-S-isoprenylcysteine O-methyltransferase Ste14
MAEIEKVASISRRKVALAAVGLLALVALPSFLRHAVWLSFGQANRMVIQGRWDIVALNIGIFLAVLLPLVLGMRWKVDWGSRSKSLGVYAAFIVSMFVEMYGVPLSFYLTSAAISNPVTENPDFLFAFTVFGQTFAMTFWKLVGASITTVGIGLVAVGWASLYRTDKELKTDGLYAYSRHPQYVGIVLVVFGWFVHWPTFLTMALLPVLVYFYYKLALKEEEEVREVLSDASKYDRYAERTPRFV